MAILTAQSLALYVLESYVSLPLMVPGAKLGLANIITLVALYVFPRWQDVFIIIALRTFLASFFGGGPGMYVYSAVGAFVSFAVMLILKKSRAFSPVGVSAAGGFFHNAAQLCLAVLLAETVSLWQYLPVLGCVGIFAGIIMGFLASKAIRLISFNVEKV